MTMDLELVARFEAFKQQRAVPFASHLHIACHDDALLLAPIVLAGDDTRIHVLAYGTPYQGPRFLCVPDPRVRDDECALLGQFAAIILPYFQDCVRLHRFPQLWVSTQAAAQLLEHLADRYRFYQRDPSIRQFAELLTYVAQRSHFADQQCLIVASEALEAHWKSGQQREEDEHLATFLTWLYPPPHCPLHQAVSAAELVPSGIKTLPSFDNHTLSPLLRNYTRARRSGASSQALASIAHTIRQVLEPVALVIYLNIRRVHAALCQAGLPPLPSLVRLEERETEEYVYFMQQLSRGTRIPLRDTLFRGCLGLSLREEAADLMQAVLQNEDRFQHANDIFTGKIVTGTVLSTSHPSYQLSGLELASWQPELHIRQRDELFWHSDLRLKTEVVAMQQQGTCTLVSLVIREGRQCVHLPDPGDTATFVPMRPDWQRRQRLRCDVYRRLGSSIWNSSPTVRTPPASLPSSMHELSHLVESLQ